MYNWKNGTVAQLKLLTQENTEPFIPEKAAFGFLLCYELMRKVAQNLDFHKFDKRKETPIIYSSMGSKKFVISVEFQTRALHFRLLSCFWIFKHCRYCWCDKCWCIISCFPIEYFYFILNSSDKFEFILGILNEPPIQERPVTIFGHAWKKVPSGGPG